MKQNNSEKNSYGSNKLKFGCNSASKRIFRIKKNLTKNKKLTKPDLHSLNNQILAHHYSIKRFAQSFDLVNKTMERAQIFSEATFQSELLKKDVNKSKSFLFLRSRQKTTESLYKKALDLNLARHQQITALKKHQQLLSVNKTTKKDNMKAHIQKQRINQQIFLQKKSIVIIRKRIKTQPFCKQYDTTLQRQTGKNVKQEISPWQAQKDSDRLINNLFNDT